MTYSKIPSPKTATLALAIVFGFLLSPSLAFAQAPGKALSRSAFDQIMHRFQQEYLPLVQQEWQGRDILFSYDYDSTGVTADHPHAISITARTLTRPHIDEAGFTLDSCFKFTQLLSLNDARGRYLHGIHYLMATNCLRKLWQHDYVTNSAYRHIAPGPLKSLCDQSHSGRDDRQLCYRMSQAAYSIARGWGDDIDLNQRSPKKADGVARGFQGSQCMFDAFLAGALCAKGSDRPLKVATIDELVARSCQVADGVPERATLPPCFYNP